MWRGSSVASVFVFGPGVKGSSPISDYYHVLEQDGLHTLLNWNGMDMEYWITDAA